MRVCMRAKEPSLLVFALQSCQMLFPGHLMLIDPVRGEVVFWLRDPQLQTAKVVEIDYETHTMRFN